MKQLLIFLFALVGMSSVQAQSTLADVNTYPYFMDTLSTSGSLDTLTFTQANDRKYAFLYEGIISSATLSGTDTATVYVQQAAFGRDKWTNIDTVTIGGSATSWKSEGDCIGGRIRYYILAPSSTQSTQVTVNHQIIKSLPTRR